VTSSRTIVIGDLHGCHDEAVALLDKCEAAANDRVIWLGDLVDRGPDNDKCVDLVMRREKLQGSPACIVGNHEQRHLGYCDVELKTGKPAAQIPTHVATRQQLRPEHYDYFRSLPLFIRLPEFNAVCVHAGCFPGLTIEQQPHRILTHAQMIRPFDKWGNLHKGKDAEKTVWPSRVPKGEESEWKFWTHFWDGPERVIFGHSVTDKPLVTDKVVGIDGGCCFGRELWAVVLPSWEIVKVPSQCGDRGKDYRGRAVAAAEEEKIRGNRINLFQIHGNVSSFS